MLRGWPLLCGLPCGPDMPRIALLGCGSIGTRHLRNLRGLGHPDVIAFDPAPAAREVVAAEHGVACCATLDDVWATQPAVAIVTSPTALHLDHALAAIGHGCHLFVEKPLAHTLAGLDDLEAEAA